MGRKDSDIKKAAAIFAKEWEGKGYEKGQSQSFWISLLQDVFGVEQPTKYIVFEEQVHLDHTSFIDAMIPETRVMIEQKSLGKNLSAPIKQSDGTLLSSFQQAKRYITELPLSKHPRWVITCNFSQFYIYDMERPGGEPEIVELKNLEKEYYRLNFLVDKENENLKREMEISIAAGDLVGLLYDALIKQYKDPTNEHSLKSLNMLCVRIVFLLYAEDSDVLGKHLMFHDYLRQFDAKNSRRALIDLFKILDTKAEDRDPYLDEELAAFPYVNGGLFADEDIEIPNLTDEIRDIILSKASEDFDWSEISPTIFGAVFESTLNPETRRSGGMHYTSIENIHRLISPLFLDDLKQELEEILSDTVIKTRNNKLKKFQDKIASLKFLDPACGSGNFLTETFIQLRRMENRVIETLTGGQMVLGEIFDPIKVSIQQFSGIEINDFAVTVAKTALWIAEHQMMKATENIIHQSLDFLPLKTNASIVEGNALRMDWNEISPASELNFLIGNPPFVGYSLQSNKQKADILSIYVDESGKPYKTAGKIDYVAGWFFKAAEMMYGRNIKTAFVSTNSITQGEQVAAVWKPLYDRFGIHIDFAHRTFVWDSESNSKAHVHCVIVGFSNIIKRGQCRLYTGDKLAYTNNINSYLIEADNVFIGSRTKPVCNVPQMIYGNKPTDGGFLFLSEEIANEVTEKEPNIKKYIKRIYGATEYINNIPRYCLWLVDAAPNDLRQSRFIQERIDAVRRFRLGSNKEATRKSAETPTLFQEIRQPAAEYIIIPRHSSENRRYIPFGFVSPEIIVNDAVQIIPNAGIYHFGILMSNIHMAWVRTVCGRIKSDYRYSKDVVYNNFPWPTPTDTQKERIEKTAQAILDAREQFPNSSLADLYDELTMPPVLRKAHQDNNRAVMDAYGFTKNHPAYSSESACVAELMRMYQKLTENEK